MIKDLNKGKKIDNVEDFELEYEVSEVTQGGGLVMLPVDKLYPHPDNPRKRLGDLSELAESIKAKGVMQNLTVVPREEVPCTYTIIIGHRRHAAAKKAGLQELPCVIVEMDDQEQMATMLLENIQRSDLTAYEQAKGFQMMMDLGDSVSGIVKKTGFSESTVRRRLKMAELDEEVLQKVSARQISFGDIDRLSEIEDLEVRNKVLADIGTANFNNSLKNAITVQKRVAVLKRMRELLSAAGLKEIPYSEYSDYSYATSTNDTFFDKDAEGEIERIKNHGAVAYCYSYSTTFYIMRPKDAPVEKSKEQLEREEKERERRERYTILDESFRKIYDLRREFIDSYPKVTALKHITEIVAFITCMSMNDDADNSVDKDDFEKLVFGENRVISSYKELYDQLVTPSEMAKALLVSAWMMTDCGADCFNWECKYDKNDSLEMIYEFLESVGYQMSDEERELLDGTSELYLKEEE